MVSVSSGLAEVLQRQLTQVVCSRGPTPPCGRSKLDSESGSRSGDKGDAETEDEPAADLRSRKVSADRRAQHRSTPLRIGHASDSR